MSGEVDEGASMIVMKFGGTSVSSKKSVEAICQLVVKNHSNESVVVVSALSKVTDALVSLCTKENFKQSEVILSEIYTKHENLSKELLDKATVATVLAYVEKCLKEIKSKLSKFYKSGAEVATLMLKDEIVFYGEKMSSFLIATIINNKTKIEAKQVLSSSCIVTNKKFGDADYLPSPTKKNTRAILLPLLKKKIVPVVTGFVGATIDGEVTTLGRGGSDYSASILGFALNVSEIQIWTDVDGVYSTDPRLVKSAKLLPVLAYEEASELANLGAKVLHPRTIKPAIFAKIPVKVLNTFNPTCEGTTILPQVKEVKSRVKAITTRKSVPLVTIKSNEMLFGKGFLKKVFTIFANHDMSIDLVSVSEVSLSITLHNAEKLEPALKLLEKLGMVTYEVDYGSLSLVGGHIMDTPHLMKDVFTILEKAKIKVHMLSYSASNINVSMVMKSVDVNMVLELFHDHFIE